MKKILLFDIDGTLLLTGGVGKIAFEKAFEELFRIPDAWGDVIPDGKTDPLIIEEITKQTLKRKLKKKEYELLCARYTGYFRDEIRKAPNFRLMPGVSALLKTLSERNDVLIGIATGNLEEAGRLKLERGNIHHYFQFGGFASDSNDRSGIIRKALKDAEKIMGHDIARELVFIIGDTEHDIRAAQTLGLHSIAVTTGGYTKKDLLRHKPTHLLKNLSDLKLFLKLIGV